MFSLAFMLIGSFAFANESFVKEETESNFISFTDESLKSEVEINEDVLGPCSTWVHVYDNGRYVGSTVVWDWHFGCEGMGVLHLNLVPILA